MRAPGASALDHIQWGRAAFQTGHKNSAAAASNTRKNALAAFEILPAAGCSPREGSAADLKGRESAAHMPQCLKQIELVPENTRGMKTLWQFQRGPH